jgi:hypothetical protein
VLEAGRSSRDLRAHAEVTVDGTELSP